jgi:trimeric autotransporter adhesin
MKTIPKIVILMAALLSLPSMLLAQASITGTASVCVGATTSLTDSAADGVWSSSNTGVATVGSNCGLVLGVAQGTAIISYTTDAGLATVAVTVNPTPIAITGPTDVCVGSVMILTDIGGGKWTSSNTLIATVGATTGQVAGKTPGAVNITYTMSGGCSVTANVTVDATPAPISGAVGVCIGSAMTLSDAPPGGMWSSDNNTVAAIDSNTGVLTGLITGSATITYAFNTSCQVTKKITVYPLPLFISGPAAVCTGATIMVSDAGGGKWSISNTSVATISTTGLVTGKSAGNANITYTLSTGCLITTNIAVNQAPTAILGAASVCTGLTIALSDAPPGGVWTNDNSTIATVDSNGVVTGIAAGTTTITYAFASGCMATKKVTVNALPNSIDGPSSVCVLSSITLNDTLTGKWTTANASIATVGASNGIVTGKAAGTAVITYALTSGCMATTVITVNPLPSVITGAASICTGSTISLSCQAGCGSWSCGNTAVATVCSTGAVTGLAAGAATLSYTLNTGCGISTKKISVNPLPSEISGTDKLCTGSTITLTDGGSGKWSTANSEIATINPTKGKVTGVSAGTAMISYTLSTGCFVTKNITVDNYSAASPLTNGESNNDGDSTSVTTYDTVSSNPGKNTIPATTTRLQVYPNPNCGSFSLLLSSGSDEQGMIYVTNILGQKVLEQQVNSNNPIPVSITRGQGIYLITVIISGERFEEKIIVTR